MYRMVASHSCVATGLVVQCDTRRRHKQEEGTVTREEYEQRRRQLEAERRAGLELIEAAHQAQIRALELVWLAGGDGTAAAVALPPLPALAAVATPRTAPAATPARARPVRPPRQPLGKLRNDIQDALATLPDTFGTRDLLHALGYMPYRGSLHRILGDLRQEGQIETLHQGEGRIQSRYRNLRRQPDGTGGDPGAPAQ